MSEKPNKPALLAAFTEAARSPAPPTPRAARVAKPRRARTDPQDAPRSPRSARGQGERINLTYRTTAPTWERLKHLAISDRVSIQELIHAALSREFERRGLPALD